jgi:hypothetical protein
MRAFEDLPEEGAALDHRHHAARLDRLDALVTRLLAFCVLKFVPGLSPAQDLAKETMAALTFDLVPGGVGLVLVATLETAIVPACSRASSCASAWRCSAWR